MPNSLVWIDGHKVIRESQTDDMPPEPTAEELDAMASQMADQMLASRAVDKTLAQFIMECVRSIKTGNTTFWDDVTDQQSFRDLFITKVREKL